MTQLPRRPVLAGNNLAGLFALDLLLECVPPEDLLVIAPAGGRHHDWQPALGPAAAERGVEVLTPDDVNDPSVVELLRARHADLLLSVYYTQLFRAPLLEAIEGPALNVHPSLLPRHRGTAPLIWAIVEGDARTGVSCHELTLGVDTGPLRWQRPLAIHPDDTGFTLHAKAANLVRAIVADLLRRLAAGRELPPAIEQSGAPSVHTSRDPRVNHLDWHEPAARIRNIVRALASPLDGAHASWRGQRLGIERVDIVTGGRTSRAPGMVELDPHLGPLVWSADHAVQLRSVRSGGAVVPGDSLIELGLTDGEVLA